MSRADDSSIDRLARDMLSNERRLQIVASDDFSDDAAFDILTSPFKGKRGDFKLCRKVVDAIFNKVDEIVALYPIASEAERVRKANIIALTGSFKDKFTRSLEGKIKEAASLPTTMSIPSTPPLPPSLPTVSPRGGILPLN